METWAIVAIVLGTNLITNLLTWFLTNRQLQAQRNADIRQRRWEVRSQPLLKLRAELACMAAKQDAMIDLAAQLSSGERPNEKKAKEQLKQAVEDYDNYFKTGNFEQALYMQDDYEVACKVDEIHRDYQKSYYDIFDSYWFGGGLDNKLTKGIESVKRNNKKVSEVQGLINKRLEEL